MTSRPSAEQRLMALSDHARRADHALARLSDTLIMTDPTQRPRDTGDGRISVTVEAWMALARARDQVAALIALALESDVEGR